MNSTAQNSPEPDTDSGYDTRYEQELAAIREDIASLEQLLARLDDLPAEVREERRSECLELIAGLTTDMEQWVAAAKIVPITARKWREGR